MTNSLAFSNRTYSVFSEVDSALVQVDLVKLQQKLATVSDELTTATEIYKSGQSNTAVALKLVKKLARRKVALAGEVNALLRVLADRT